MDGNRIPSYALVSVFRKCIPFPRYQMHNIFSIVKVNWNLQLPYVGVKEKLGNFISVVCCVRSINDS